MPRGSFYFKGAKVFLTYSQCPVTKEELLAHLETLGKLSEYVIGRERHEDGNYHLHASLKYSPRIQTRSAGFFDFNGFHPNIEIPSTKGDLQATAKYAAKDGDFIQKGSLLKSTRTELFAALLLEKKLSLRFVESHPDILALNYHSICAWLRFCQNERTISNNPSLAKKRHLWVHGGSNTGKTTWLRTYVATYTRPREIPPNDDWSHVDPSVDLLFKDEFAGSLTIQKLNSLCDGLTILNTKGGSTNLGQPIIVICSNYSIESLYSNSNLLDTLYNRFIVYNLDTNPGVFP